MTRISFLLFLAIIPMIGIAEGSEPILITISDTMHEVIFDGKWSFKAEWKRSSLDTLTFGDGVMHLRSAHQGDFIYFFVDFVSDQSIDVGKDKAMICLDTDNDKTTIPNENDFCFLTILEANESKVFQGTHDVENSLKEISIPKNFIANSSRSDHNDRYSDIPHAGYEFKIPTDLVGRSSEYGLSLLVYDEFTNQTFIWPYESNQSFKNLNPSLWGEMISPDKSLPEFHWIFFILIAPMILIIFLSRYNNILKLNYF